MLLPDGELREHDYQFARMLLIVTTFFYLYYLTTAQFQNLSHLFLYLVLFVPAYLLALLILFYLRICLRLNGIRDVFIITTTFAFFLGSAIWLYLNKTH